MSEDSQSNQQRLVQEMFDVANIAQSEPMQSSQPGLPEGQAQTPQPSASRSATANNGISADNIQIPENDIISSEE